MARLSPIPVEQRTSESAPLPFGQNLLGLSKLPESFYEDIPIEYFHDEDKENPLGDGGSNGKHASKSV